VSQLFSPFRLRGIQFKNRIIVSPMAQYSADGGIPNEWHLVHLGSRAVGGAALIMVEATAVSPEGRITPWDCGMWSDDHARAFERIAAFMSGQGAVPGIQLAHAGRKASTDTPWRESVPLSEKDGGWQLVAPSPIAFSGSHAVPREISPGDIQRIVAAFAQAARRSVEAGFQVVELHMAHGYLAHEFLSPLSNQRKDPYGGGLENRARFPLEVASAVRESLPDPLPLLVRISCTDWVEGGWDLTQSMDLCRWFKGIGVDLIDCSSGGLIPNAAIPAGPGFQTPFAAAIREKVGIPTGAVGLITHPAQAEQIVATGQADVVLLGREFLRDPYWPFRAARALDVDLPWPSQYLRAKL
jgi:2,4-dienoyl-CoA reductase-like NADH-dependent reductase (Old Yellow Enzyme family)